jgi:hypothetical protein
MLLSRLRGLLGRLGLLGLRPVVAVAGEGPAA